MEREVENAQDDMLLVIVDIDDCPELKSKYHAGSVPTVIAFVNGREVDRFVGEYDQDFVHQFLGDLPSPN